MHDGVVAFLDILGFSNLVEREVAGEPEALYASLKLALPELYGVGDLGERFPTDFIRTFTDNTVLCQRVLGSKGEPSMSILLTRIASYQLRMAVAGYFVRGGLTVGSINFEGDFVFGSALLRSYELESRIANWPRVVVDGSCKDWLSEQLRATGLKQSEPLHTDEVVLDHDGKLFVNYLSAAWDLGPNPEHAIGMHRKMVVERLADTSLPVGVRQKFERTAHYHDWFVDAGRLSEELKVGAAATLPAFRRIAD